jgi:hypothetical protein
MLCSTLAFAAKDYIVIDDTWKAGAGASSKNAFDDLRRLSRLATAGLKLAPGRFHGCHQQRPVIMECGGKRSAAPLWLTQPSPCPLSSRFPLSPISNDSGLFRVSGFGFRISFIIHLTAPYP